MGREQSASVPGLDQVRRSLERIGYQVTNTVQGQPDGVWFICAPHAAPLRIGSEAELRRVLAIHERFLSKPDGRARIERWRAIKLRNAKGIRPTYGDCQPRRGR